MAKRLGRGYDKCLERTGERSADREANVQMTARGADCPLGPAHVHDASASPNAAHRPTGFRCSARGGSNGPQNKKREHRRPRDPPDRLGFECRRAPAMTSFVAARVGASRGTRPGTRATLAGKRAERRRARGDSGRRRGRRRRGHGQRRSPHWARTESGLHRQDERGKEPDRRDLRCEPSDARRITSGTAPSLAWALA